MLVEYWVIKDWRLFDQILIQLTEYKYNKAE
jgi:hypothetical protein